MCNSTSIGEIIKIGQSMTIECAEGNELVREKMAYIVNRLIILDGLGALGNVRVLARMSSTRKAVSYRLTEAFKSITLKTYRQARGPVVFGRAEHCHFRNAFFCQAWCSLASLGINFGPDGAQFSVQVILNAHFCICIRELRVHRYNPKTNNTAKASWTQKPYPETNHPLPLPSIVKATTSSFSAYFVLAVDPAATIVATPASDAH